MSAYDLHNHWVVAGEEVVPYEDGVGQSQDRHRNWADGGSDVSDYGNRSRVLENSGKGNTIAQVLRHTRGSSAACQRSRCRRQPTKPGDGSKVGHITCKRYPGEVDERQ